MILKDMIDTLDENCMVLIKDYEGEAICQCMTESKGAIPYLHYPVTEWSPSVNFAERGFEARLDDRQVLRGAD